MKNLPKKRLKKSEVLKVMLVFVFTAFFMSCSNEPSVNQNAESATTEQQNPSNTKRLPYYDGVIVRAWGAHNIDCSQPEGFCNFVRYNWTYYGFMKPDADGTPVRVTNEADKFVMTIQKSALTPEHKKGLLRNGEVYVIPEGQTIDPELVKSLKLNSNILVPGKYPIQESEETYTIAFDVK